MKDDFVEISSGIQLVSVDLRVYPLVAVAKTAYWFTSRCYIHIEHQDHQTLSVRFKPKEATVITNLAEEFMNRLLDQALRERLAAETEAFRNLVVAHALSKTCLIGGEQEAADPINDPLNISKADGIDHAKIA